MKTSETWASAELQALSRDYQGAAILNAAAELDLFAAVKLGSSTVEALAQRLQCDLRGLRILLDALAALRLLKKAGNQYSLADGLEAYLTAGGSQSILAITQHHANCLRNWGQLARVVKTGRPAEHRPSIRGEGGDRAAFVGGMDNLAGPVAHEIIQAVQPLRFERLLDIGGALGTWTIAFLDACPAGLATLVDLPEVIPLARERMETAGLAHRVQLVAADFMVDDLPPGADLAWLSAIVHQNSRAQNRALFTKIHGALRAGGRIAIRDVLMQENRAEPKAGALFAVNMLVATEGGGTYTAAELQSDLVVAGFTGFIVAREDPAMHSVILACKPGSMVNHS